MTARAPLLLLALLSGCDGDPAATDAPPADTAPPTDTPDFGDPLAGIGAVETIQGGFQFTEGPQWHQPEQALYFTDIPASTIYRYLEGQQAMARVMPSNMANGLAVDGNNMLVAAEHGSRSVSRNGGAIATMFEGKRLNSPNDVVVAADGTIYFTDPPYGINNTTGEIGFNGVFRLAPDGALTAERRGAKTERPNGIGLSPSGRTLYVADTSDGAVYQFPIQADGALGERAVFAQTAGGADGLAIDTGGNLFVTSNAGIEVFAPSGTRWGAITVPMKPANCAFGGTDHKTLYITAQSTLYRVRLTHAGRPNR